MRMEPTQLNRQAINVFVAAACLLFIFESMVERANAQGMKEGPPSIQSILSGDPQKDFERAKAAHDLHFLAVRGITVEVPGIPPDAKKRYPTIRVETIVGTSDVLDAVQTRNARKKVRRYAEIYNNLVFAELERKRGGL
jgi:hypothetical protein